MDRRPRLRASGRRAVRGKALHHLFARVRDAVVATFALIISAPPIAILYVFVRPTAGSGPLDRQIYIGKNGKSFQGLRIRNLHSKAAAAPMLWNVLRGDMSLVGPRAIRVNQAKVSPKLVPTVPPGLTGLHQISGDRARPSNETPSYDAFYAFNRSFGFDLWLIWRTLLLAVLDRETSLSLAAKLWERNRAWRHTDPEEAAEVSVATTPWARYRFNVLAALIPLLVFVAPGALTALSARQDLLEAQATLTQARRGASNLNVESAEANLSKAAEHFASARGKLESWRTLPLRAIPALNNNISVPIAIARAGESLVTAGGAGIRLLELLPLDEGERSLFQDGNLNLKAFTAASQPARRLHTNMQQAKARISASPRGFLLPPVANARDRSLQSLDKVLGQAEAAAAATQLLPSMFGRDGRRTWVLGAENNAELRGRGGYLGTFGLLTAENGQLDLGDFRSVGSLPDLPTPAMSEANPEYARQYLTLGGISAWPNLMMSPDFPTGAELLVSSLEEVGGIPSDGLVSVNPMALSYLLEVTGPVTIPDIPEPITADTVVEWTLNRLYFLYDGESTERREQLSAIAEAVWEKVLTGDVDTVDLAEALGKAAVERHLVLFSRQPQEQALFESMGLAGEVTDSRGDYLLLVSQNLGESKMDYYLSRDISYSGHLDADGTLIGATTIKVTNHAPKNTELPGYITGEHLRPNSEVGRTRTFLSLFVPQRAQLQQMLRDGRQDTAFENTAELGKRRFATYVKVGPGETEELTFRYRLPLAVRDGGYRLDVQKQSMVRPDTLEVDIEVPKDLSVAATDGFTDDSSGLSWEGKLTSDISISAQLDRSFIYRAASRLNSLLRSPIGYIDD